MSYVERTGWRDEWISRRHRTWCRNVPCVDLDCVLTKNGAEMGENGWQAIEYDNREPVAIIEYKSITAVVNKDDANNTTLKRLADRASLPFFVVIYNQANVKFGVVPLNDLALQLLPADVVMNEAQYQRFLLMIRGR